MTERIEATAQGAEDAMMVYRERVHALYRDVALWLAGDRRLRFERSPFGVVDGLGEYEVDRLRVFAGGERIADFRPKAATVLFGAGLIQVRGLVDYASLHYFESSPTYTTTNGGRSASDLSTIHLFSGIDRPGWYWNDVRFDDARFIDRHRLADLFEGISDFERERS